MNDSFNLAPDEWKSLRRLLDQALDRPAAERAGWLAALGPEDVRFRPRLQALLAHAADATASPTVARLLDTLPQVETAQFASALQDGALAAGSTVGPYRLLRPLGEGGMGEVWLAERADLLQSRQVALKLPRRVTGHARLAERLAREREILAALEHPNIARLYDAGVSADGQPYLALEYVEGERIDAWCVRKALDVPARLRLFLQVARAVAHAHARLVVHRDLKPANILVTEAGEVRLLDFGIAKMLADGRAQETELTQLAGRALTPDYAAPEQILGQPIGTAADVYALGVVLFELLTASRPYKLKRDSRAALEEAIAQAEVERPSSVVADAGLKRRLRGDLDTIVLTALKRTPAERYSTVEALADDIERHLDQRPVRARTDAAGYRLRKFVARNRLAVTAAAAAAIALVGGSGLALWQAREARAQQARADLEARHARTAERIANANTVLADFLANDLGQQRSTTELESQFERAAAMVRAQYGDDPLLRAHLLAGVAGRYRRIGNFAQWRTLAAEAESAASAAGDTLLAAQLACHRARDLAQSGAIAAARTSIDAAVASLEQHGARPSSTLITCLADASAIARLAGAGARAVATAERIRDIEVANGHANSATHAESMLILARAYALVGRFGDAAAAARRGVDLLVSLGHGQSPAANNLRSMLAMVLRDGGQPGAALRLQDELLRDHAARGGDARTFAGIGFERAVSLVRAGRAAEAVTALRAAQQDARTLGDNTLRRASTVALVSALIANGQVDDARVELRDAQRDYATPLAEGAYVARLVLFARAETELAAGDLDATAAALDEAERVLAGSGQRADPALRMLHALRSRLELAAARPAAALEHAGRALDLSRAHALDPQASVYVAEDLLAQAQARSALGDRAGAVADAQQARAAFEASGVSEHRGLALAQQLLR
jgi:serine/threonine-protein kinase